MLNAFFIRILNLREKEASTNLVVSIKNYDWPMYENLLTETN